MADTQGLLQSRAPIPSAAYSSTQTTPDIVNTGSRYLTVILDVTVVGTSTWTVSIQGKDPASGKYYTILAGAAVSTNVTNVYKVGPSLTAAANSVANDIVPETFRIVATYGGTGAGTFSLGYVLS